MEDQIVDGEVELSCPTQIGSQEAEMGISEESNQPHSEMETEQSTPPLGAEGSVEEECGEDSSQQQQINSLQHDTEMVSEDEFSVEGGKVALETEEVSDEELPASITENLETEAVSDEELPPLGKRKKKGRSQDSNSSDKEAPSKKTKFEKSDNQVIEEKDEEDKNLANKPIHPITKSDLVELEKYWKAVNDDQTDFTGWTYLLQYVDQETDIEAAREAYDAFLALYPYCYGYWRKYADYERRKGDKDKCEEILLIGR